ncbi:glycosyltransferase [Novosphingobium piscinae]|uniref:Glycosyltransferase n=1 Tax=Novosphingobium piscinae TaxID=1507448 RepID=A0A7X1KP86_9SPHN|nr:glycosyltransferase [Novosphingobium piscinae]MBC2668115.1 glycosyltransferase [Novosphingobium piscinae]
MTFRPNSLVLVIPTVCALRDGAISLDGDFANNVRAYLAAFSHVHVMTTAAPGEQSFPNTVPLADLADGDRLTITILPEPYREDRYFRNRGRVKAQLHQAMSESEFHLISPHAAFDWPTLAAEVCQELGIPYNMEADWALPVARAELWRMMPWGPNKLRKYIWGLYHDRQYYRALDRSALALLQGGEVFNELGHRAPNAFSVLNVQITGEDRIAPAALAAKLARSDTQPVKIFYAGRAAPMKGPHVWLEIVRRLKLAGCRFEATWAGAGPELDSMQRFVDSHGLGDVCVLAGHVDRDETRRRMADADLFVFCHLIAESPRCLVESLASGTPIVGFESHYARDLVARHGGGAFVPRGDTARLADMVTQLVSDRAAIRQLTIAAAASGQTFDRDTAIEERIGLMKRHLQWSSAARRA